MVQSVTELWMILILQAVYKVIETISVLKFPQVQGSLQLAREVSLDQIAYENEARGLKSLKILGLSLYIEGTIGDEAVNNPNPTDCNVIETIGV